MKAKGPRIFIIMQSEYSRPSAPERKRTNSSQTNRADTRANDNVDP
jgi:hypothetical protein